MPDVTTVLVDLGFTESEARAYLALLERGPLTGYEVAKVSGVPRGNIYHVLEKLELRGAVVKSGHDGSTRYASVTPEEMLPRLAEQVQRKADQARVLLEGVRGPAETEQVWNVQGYGPLVDHARSMLTNARGDLTVALCREEAAVLGPDMRRTHERGVAFGTLCLTGCAEECGACQGQISRYAVAPLHDSRWLMLVRDEEEVLAGEIFPTSEAGVTSFRTRQRLLANLIGGYVRRSIVLAQIAEQAGTGELAEAARRAISPWGIVMH